MKRIMEFLKDERGATAIEYGLLAALVSVAIVAALKLVSTELQETYTTVSSELNTAQGT